MELPNEYTNNARKNAMSMLQGTLPSSVWQRHFESVQAIQAIVKSHRMSSHPILPVLYEGALSREDICRIHLDYRHAIVEIFTDALAMAIAQAKQLEPRLPGGAKMAPRFLLTLNALDEFGFSTSKQGGLQESNPEQAHYPLFEKVLLQLGIDNGSRKAHRTSAIARQLRHWLQEAYTDYAQILALLAVAEEQVIVFSPALRKATAHFGIDVGSGYYNVHGTTGDSLTNACDDDHEEDLWCCLVQAFTPEQEASLTGVVSHYLELWNDFWSYQLDSLSAKAPKRALRVQDSRASAAACEHT